MILITKNAPALFNYLYNITDTSRMIVHTSITGFGGSILGIGVILAMHN